MTQFKKSIYTVMLLIFITTPKSLAGHDGTALITGRLLAWDEKYLVMDVSENPAADKKMGRPPKKITVAKIYLVKDKSLSFSEGQLIKVKVPLTKDMRLVLIPQDSSTKK